MLNYAGGTPVTAYNLTRSLRFRASASAYLNRTPASASNRKTWTLSAWVKRGKLSSTQDIFSAGLGTGGGADETFLRFSFSSTDQLSIGGNVNTWLTTTPVYRDPSAWYHIVLAFDATQATATNRILFYVNGVQVTAFATNNLSLYVSNQNYAANNTVPQVIGIESGASAPPAGTFYLDGYLAEVNFIDGQALTPSSFGSTSATTGVWQPAKYSGTYGTNGFYLPFTDNSALTTASNVGLGKDFSGNTNYWVTNNISITAGVTYDSMTDVPTLTSATAANFAVLNPLSSSTNLTFSNANLATTYAAGTWNVSRASIGITSGSWYWEVTAGGANNNFIGIANGAAAVTDALGVNSNSAGWNFGGSFFYNGTSVNFAVVWTTGDVIGVAFNATTNVITFYKNGVVVNSGGTATAVTGGLYFPANSQSAGTFNVNFGQRPFSYTPPTGFVALNTYNLPTSTIVKGNTVMDATLYTGTLLSNAIVNAAAFKPDLVWVKSRSAATDNKLTDSVRGVTKGLISNTTGAETTDVQGLTAFNANGFTVGTNLDYNNLAATYVAWQWQAGQGSSGANTNGTITSTVSVNASAGFSVATYTGNATAGATVGHGLGVAPSFIYTITRSPSGNVQQVYHSSIGNTGAVFMNSTQATNTALNWWNNTSPTSSVFTLGNGSYANGSGSTMVAYSWAAIAGFSSFGNYIGNASAAGPFIYTGFRPKFVLVKCSSAANSWVIWDGARTPYNQESLSLLTDSAGAEISNTDLSIDALSNGFKLKGPNANSNASGATFIYAAFAENPFKNSLAR